jgi:hypothetical protein
MSLGEGATDVYPHRSRIVATEHIKAVAPPSPFLRHRSFLEHDAAAVDMTQHPPRTSSLPRQRDGVPPQPGITAIGLGTSSETSQPIGSAAKQNEAVGNSNVKAGPDVLSDKATAAFIRRTLCAQHALAGTGATGRSTPRPVDELLPPLTSSNEIDLQLYAILAVILKEFVYAWYSKITPDQVFVDEVIQIIAHCTRALEQRIRKADLEAILLDELPQLVDTHIKCKYRIVLLLYPNFLFISSR